MRIIKFALFWALSLTWGSVMTILGAVVALALLLTGHRPRRFHYNIYFEIGKDWGGVSFGAFIFVDRNNAPQVLGHEAGHGLQNIMLGVLFPFLVAIPSAARYWWREYLIRSGRRYYSDLPDYDAIWFEGWATRLGEKYFN